MATRKKRRGAQKPVARADGGMTPFEPDVIQIPEEPEPEDTTVKVDPTTGIVAIENEDGSITIDPTGRSLWKAADDDDDSDFDQNLAAKVDPIELTRVAEDQLTAIDADKSDLSQWLQMRAKTIELLGMKLEDPKSDVSTSALGMSTSVVRDPILLEAVEQFRANAYAELCPSGGPVKVRNFSDDTTGVNNDLAEALQKDLNYYLTTTASEYYPDTYHMLWWTGLTSGTFKKVYECPLRQRPVSEAVEGTDLIVPTNATDLKNASRITHQIRMDKATFRAMQLQGVYIDFALTDPMPPVLNAVEQKKANIEGKAPQPQRPEDQEYVVYECYCRLDLKGFEHEDDGEPSGLPLPYVVTIDETSRRVLAIRRNWDEADDDAIYKPAKIPFVLFPFSTGLSRIYGSGLGQMGGNIASAMTALMRITIDGGMMSNYPGLLKGKGTGRQIVNEIRVPPGGCAEIDTGGLPIQQVVMPMPYKDMSPNMIAYQQQLREVGKSLMGSAQVPVGEGKQDAPVGTTLAMIEQATKVMAANHKMLHAAQSEEFRLLTKLFKRNPAALFAGNERPALGKGKEQQIAQFKLALDNCEIVPVADPNVPSDMHRKLMAAALKQMTMGNPAYDQVKIDRFIAKSVFKMSDQDFNNFLAPQQPNQMPPEMMLKVAELQQKAQAEQGKQAIAAGQLQLAHKKQESQEQIEAAKLAASMHDGGRVEQVDPTQDIRFAAEHSLKDRKLKLDEAGLALKAHDSQRDRDSKEAIEAFKLANTSMVHPEAAGIGDQTMDNLSAFIVPAAQARGTADGGRVEAVDPGDAADEMDNIARALQIARRIGGGYYPSARLQ